MKDVFAESVVPVKPMPIYQIANILMTGIFGLSILGVMLFMRQLLAVAICAAVALGSFFLKRRFQEKTDGEYEYIHCNDQLDIDVVARSERRRHLLTVDLERAVLLAPQDHPDLDPYDCLEEKDFTGNTEECPVYCLVLQGGGKSQKLLLSLNEKMYDSLKLVLRSKVKK